MEEIGKLKTIDLAEDEKNIMDFEVKEEKNEQNDFATKLAEYVTGLKPEDPAIVDRMIEDQKIIRTKYGLPKRELIGTPYEYEIALRKIANTVGVVIRDKSECGDFFEKYSSINGVHFGNENKIGMRINKGSLQDYMNSMGVLEHELIHALQKHYAPRMPIEQMEYEAYVAGGNNEMLRDNPYIVSLIFNDLIGFSVRHWYSALSEERGENIEPEWLGKQNGVETIKSEKDVGN